MKSHFRKYPEIPEETKNKIIEQWRFTKLNSIPTIAAKFNIPKTQINEIINRYLSEKCKSLNSN